MEDLELGLSTLQEKLQKKAEEKRQKNSVKINRLNQEIGKYKSAIAAIERRKRTHQLIQLGAIISNAFEIDPLDIDPEEFKEFIQTTKSITLPIPEKYVNGKRQLFGYNLNKAWNVFHQNREKNHTKT